MRYYVSDSNRPTAKVEYDDDGMICPGASAYPDLGAGHIIPCGY